MCADEMRFHGSVTTPHECADGSTRGPEAQLNKEKRINIVHVGEVRQILAQLI
jgi:hypothetical protein